MQIVKDCKQIHRYPFVSRKHTTLEINQNLTFLELMFDSATRPRVSTHKHHKKFPRHITILCGIFHQMSRYIQSVTKNIYLEHREQIQYSHFMSRLHKSNLCKLNPCTYHVIYDMDGS